MEAAVAALEAAAEKTAGAASAAKEAAVAASAAATEAAGAATAAKEAAMAALATAEQAAAASSAAKEAAESAAAAAATARELAAAMRCSKKRRFHQIDDGGSRGGSRNDRGDLDLISALPDDVLGSIISRLPTNDGARTQAISRRWLPLWRSAPLNLAVDFLGPVSTKSKRMALVSKILSEHPGPARRLSLKWLSAIEVPVIDGWLHSQALDSLEELNLTNMRDMPLSVFRFAPTLCVARFIHCDLPKSISTLRLNFPCLKQLTLHGILVMEDALHNLLSGCTALESLELTYFSGIGAICISSQTLRSFAFISDPRSDILQLVIKDAPSLERLLPLYPQWAVMIQVIQAPKLEVLGLLSEGLSKFQFGTTIFEKMIAVSLTTKIHTMKVLVLNSTGPNLDAVVNFLRCFPCLSQPTNDMNNARKYDLLDPIECLELHLKKVVLMNYNGSKRPSVEFAKFFVLNSKLLKEMEIEVLNNRNDKWMANQRKQLCVDNRASRDARIELKIGTKKSNLPKMDTHDLLMPDPFESRAFR